ncbi:MAG: AAA family ATPase [Thermodesulfobacteriaceae bacterium]|nr:AAA family ATPase [Thermodesulfobacteriaceae bacterium]MDW8136127.1 AAA family ATPase [Thermodesulfobacterium sp.]
MKPLYLSIKGFGPYVKVELKEETFKILNEGRLFLITGEIGAGKTTLLDAILFALFGESSLSDRKPSDLISHFLKNHSHLIPEVQFKFYLNGKSYFIIRRPSLGNLSESVSLWIEDRLFSTKKTEVAEKIKELIGLGPKQFKKVFLIPQGEYRNILLSPPKERKELLQLIFETHFFSSLEDFLKEKTKELEKNLQYLEEQEKIYFNLAQVSNFLELESKLLQKEAQLKDLKNKLLLINFEKEQIERKLKEREEPIQILENLKKISEELQKLSLIFEEIKEKEKLLIKYQTLQNYIIYYESIKKLKKAIKKEIKEKLSFTKKLVALKQDKEKLEKSLTILKEKEAEIENKRHEKSRIEETIDFWKKGKEQKEKLKRIYEILKLKEKTWLQSKERLEILQKELEKLNLEINRLKDFLLLKKEYEEKLRFRNKLDRMKYLNINLKNLKIRVDNLKEQIKKTEERKIELRNSYYAEELVKLLKPKTPCPVCGSKIHPNPKKPELFQESYQSLEIQEKNLKEELEKVSRQIYLIEGEINSLKKDLPDIREEDLKESLEKLVRSLEDFKEVEENLKHKPNWKEELEKKYKFLSEKLFQNKKEEENLRKEIENLRSEISVLEGSLKEIEEILKGQRLDENWELLLKKLEEEIYSWENQKKFLEKRLENLSYEEIKINVSIKNLEEKMALDFKELKDNFLKILEAIKSKSFSHFKEIKNFFLKISEKDILEREIKDFYENWEYLKKSYQSEEGKLKGLGYNTWDERTLTSLKEDLELLNNKKAKIEKELKELYEQKGSLEEVILKLKEIKQKYEESEKKKKTLEENYSLLKNLTHLIEGKNKKGISFHSYVLSIFVKFILNRANLYLREFSIGRYKFVEEEILSKSMILEVFDYYTGSKREVKTLSGGESFIATLALALGTSDVLLRVSQAKPLETLLIDEGFGSLDELTLERVMEGLFHLANYSGRIIGIISHLKELKDKFPLVLEVKKNPSAGSSVELLKKF